MTYASEQLYNTVIRKNLAIYASTIKVKEILPHLPCLTLTDREDVEAKKDNAGNYSAVQMLMDNLRRREHWPEELISALRKCEHWKLADEISDAYDRIRGKIKTAVAAAPPQAPASDATAAATVTTATVHTVPATTLPPLTPPTVHAPATPVAVPKVPETKHVEQINVPPPVPPSEPATQAPVVVSSQASPIVDVSASVTLPVPQNVVPTHSGTTENKAILNNPDGQTVTSDGNVISNAQSSFPNTSQSQITNPQNSFQTKSEKDWVPLAVEETSDNPIQDTNPPLKQERSQVPEECSDPTVNEIQRTNTTELPVTAQTTSIQAAQVTPSVPTEVVTHAMPSISQEYVSKPSILQNPGEALSVSQEEPCSTVSSDLQISETTACSAEPRQSTSLSENHSIESLSSINERPDLNICTPPNQPQEDHYESLIEGQTLTISGHFAEEPSALNLNGQPPSMLGNTANTGGGSVNLQRSMVITQDQPFLNRQNTENVAHLCKPSGRDAFRTSDHEKSANVNYQEQESDVTRSEQIGKGSDGIGQRIGQYHLIAAAAVVGIGLLMVWKIKH